MRVISVFFGANFDVTHTSLAEMIITESMHQQKQPMAYISDGVMTLPGGYGTTEEFFEVLTWLQLELHKNPIGLLNVGGFYDPLLLQIDLMVVKKFLKPMNRELVLSQFKPNNLIEMMENFNTKTRRCLVWRQEFD